MNFPTVQVESENLEILEQTIIGEHFYKCLHAMFKNTFSKGRNRFYGLYVSEKVKPVLNLRFKYYKNFYDFIEEYWDDILPVVTIFEFSVKISHPGELLILVIRNDAKHWQYNDYNKSNLRTLNDAWYEYQRCLMTKEVSKKLDILIKRLKKKIPKYENENDLIMQIIKDCASIKLQETKEFKAFQKAEFNWNDYTVRTLRNNRDKF